MERVVGMNSCPARCPITLGAFFVFIAGLAAVVGVVAESAC